MFVGEPIAVIVRAVRNITDTLCGQSAESLNFKAGGTYRKG